MAKMTAQAAFLKTLLLELQEKAEIFKIWIQPVVQLTAKIYEPSQKVLSALNVVFKMALGLSSWGLSPAMVAEPVNRGGVATFPRASWVRYQFGQLFQTVLKDKLQFTGTWVEGFESWAQDVGLSVKPQFLPYLQPAVVRLRTRSWVQASCQVFLRLQQKVSAQPLVGPPDNMPLWHNVLFRNSKGHTYYSPKLVRKGVTKLAEVMEGGGGGLKNTISLPPTWLTVYQAAIPFVMSLPIQDLPNAWVKQGTKMLTAMQPLEVPQKQHEPEVWEQLAKLKMPGPQKDFVRKALWKKLTVGARTQKAYHQPNCNLCSVPETIKHVFSGCKFWSVACGIVTKTFGPVWGPIGVMCPMKMLLVHQPLLSLQTTQGLALWAAARAGWVLRCEARFWGGSSSMSDFVSAWATIVHTWASAAQMSFVK